VHITWQVSALLAAMQHSRQSNDGDSYGSFWHKPANGSPNGFGALEIHLTPWVTKYAVRVAIAKGRE
jgi:hypothetical protein